jgi:hypothetical protein
MEGGGGRGMSSPHSRGGKKFVDVRRKKNYSKIKEKGRRRNKIEIRRE